MEVSQTYEKGKPKPGGLSDLKLGTLDRNLKCETDGAGVQDSPGYFGHIELAKPMFHIGFVTNVVKVLRCVSYHSSKLLCGPVSLVTYLHGSSGSKHVSARETIDCSRTRQQQNPLFLK